MAYISRKFFFSKTRRSIRPHGFEKHTCVFATGIFFFIFSIFWFLSYVVSSPEFSGNAKITETEFNLLLLPSMLFILISFLAYLCEWRRNRTRHLMREKMESIMGGVLNTKDE